MMMTTRRRSSIQATAAAINEVGPLSPSPWDMMLQRRRSSLGLSALLGLTATTNGDGSFAGENGGRLSWALSNDPQSMFGAIAELAGIADDLTTAANAPAPSSFPSSSAPSSSSSSPGKFDGGADIAVPDMEMNIAAEEDGVPANFGFANTIRRASITLNALLSGASDPVFKPTISLLMGKQGAALAAQAASAAVAAAAAAAADADADADAVACTPASDSESDLDSPPATPTNTPAAPQLTIEVEPWAMGASRSTPSRQSRKRFRDYETDDDSTAGSASEAGSPLPAMAAMMAGILDTTTPPPAKKHAASSKTGQKRPRRVPPNSRAVLEAMPKPPPRGQKNLVKEEMYASMEPEAARLEKNRQSAKECRLRKKEYVFNLEKKVAEFENREVGRAAELAAVRAQLAQLQREYDDAVAKKAGQK